MADSDKGGSWLGWLLAAPSLGVAVWGYWEHGLVGTGALAVLVGGGTGVLLLLVTGAIVLPWERD